MLREENVGKSVCGHENAVYIWKRVLQCVECYVPPDINIYGKVFVEIFSDIPTHYAENLCKLIEKERCFPTRGDLVAMSVEAHASVAEDDV